MNYKVDLESLRIFLEYPMALELPFEKNEIEIEKKLIKKLIMKL